MTNAHTLWTMELLDMGVNGSPGDHHLHLLHEQMGINGYKRNHEPIGTADIWEIMPGTAV